MTTKEYEQFVISSARIGLDNIPYSIMGLTGEAGEVAEWYKKVVYRGSKKLGKADLLSELGDVLHYLTRISIAYGFNLNEIMEHNEDKIKTRQGGK